MLTGSDIVAALAISSFEIIAFTGKETVVALPEGVSMYALTGREVIEGSPDDATIYTLTGKEAVVGVPMAESIYTLTRPALLIISSPDGKEPGTEVPATKTTVLGSPELIVAIPSFNAFTLKLIAPLEGMVIECGADTTAGLLLLMSIVKSLPIRGEMLTFILPLLPGNKASWPGLKKSFDDESAAPTLAEP
jgi:hypothetical protein